jgi:hypothetical protein
MKILKEHKCESFVSIFFEEDGEIFYANVNNIRGFNICTIYKAYEKDGDYGIDHPKDLYFTRDVELNKRGLIDCIEDFCETTKDNSLSRNPEVQSAIDFWMMNDEATDNN